MLLLGCQKAIARKRKSLSAIMSWSDFLNEVMQAVRRMCNAVR